MHSLHCNVMNGPALSNKNLKKNWSGESLGIIVRNLLMCRKSNYEPKLLPSLVIFVGLDSNGIICPETNKLVYLHGASFCAMILPFLTLWLFHRFLQLCDTLVMWWSSMWSYLCLNSLHTMALQLLEWKMSEGS